MAERNDWNSKIIAEFRADEGRVAGPFQGAPIVLVHHRGRKTDREYVTPMMYMASEADDDVIYVFASKSGAPTNPDWYYNLTSAGDGTVERGTATYDVRVRELTDGERDEVYSEQARRYPGFADYEQRTRGVRTIPVLELTRVRPLTRGSSTGRPLRATSMPRRRCAPSGPGPRAGGGAAR